MPQQEGADRQTGVAELSTTVPADVRDVPVSDVMSPTVVAVRADCHLSVAMDRFAGTGLHHLVVVDGESRVAGLLTRERIAAAWLEPHSRRPIRVQDVVEAGGVVLAPRTSVREAARLMLDHGMHALPVVRGDGALVGVLSWTDLVALLATG